MEYLQQNVHLSQVLAEYLQQMFVSLKYSEPLLIALFVR